MKMLKELRFRSTTLFIVALAVLVLFEASIRDVSSQEKGDVEQISGGEERQQITIIMDEYTFKPDTIILQEGVEAEIVLINEGKEMHEFTTDHPINGEVKVDKVIIEAYGIGELEIEPNGEATITFTPEEKGRFPFSCRVKEEKDHYKEGMRGILEVR